MPVQTKIQLRRDTAANWASTNPILASGEFGYETDTGKFKIGNGTDAWGPLAYGPGGISYSTGTNVIVDRATNLASSGVGLPYQGAANSTVVIPTSTGDNGKSVVIASGIPALSKLTASNTYFTSTSSANFAALVNDATGTGLVVFNGSPALTTPTISSGGAVFSGSTSGGTTLKASAAAGSGTLVLPAPSGTETIITAETTASNYLALNPAATQTITKGLTLTGALSGVTTLAASSTVTFSNYSSTSGVLKTTSGGALQAGQKVHLQNDVDTATVLQLAQGGTGGATVDAARQGLRIFVQSTRPTTGMQAGDLWFW